MSETLQTTDAPETQVRDRADVRRQIKLSIIYAVAALLLLRWALSIDDPYVLYTLGDKRSKEHPAETMNGLRVVWIAFGIVVVGLLAALVNRIPRGWVGLVVHIVVGVAFYAGFVVWYFADQPAGDFESAIANPLPTAVTKATPLVLGALAGCLCERSGVINIAIEGQLLAGAFFASVASSLAYTAEAGLIGGILAGVGIAALLAWFAIKYQVNQVVLGVVLIALATGLTDFLLGQIPSGDDNQKLHDYLNAPLILPEIAIPGLSDIPVIGEALFDQSLLVYLTYVSVALVTFLLFETKWGLRVRSVGEHPKAADTVGIKVNRVRWQAVLLGGVFAGLGGAYFTVGSTGAFDSNASAGNGFMALAAVIMGRWHPIGATCAGLFFGLMWATQDLLGLVNKIDTNLLSAAPYVVTVVAVAGFIGRMRPPAANGQPYVKD